MRITRKILYVAVALTVVAASMHAWAMPEHFGEWWGYGVFFLLVAAAQGFYGVALLRRAGPSLFLLGIAGNLAVVVLYIVTRTVGIPFFGPHAGVVEELGVLGLSATVIEVTLVIALVASLRFARRQGASDSIQGIPGAGIARMGESGEGFSRRDFLRTAGVAGALEISGGGCRSVGRGRSATGGEVPGRGKG